MYVSPTPPPSLPLPPPLHSPEFHSLTPDNPVHNNQRAFSIAEESFNISPLLQPTEMETPDHLAVFTYLSLFYEFFADVEPGQLGSGRPQKATVPQLTPTKRKLVNPLLVQLCFCPLPPVPLLPPLFLSSLPPSLPPSLPLQDRSDDCPDSAVS